MPLRPPPSPAEGARHEPDHALVRRRLAAAGYATLGQHHPHTLADIAVRGRLYRSSHVPGDPQTTAFNEGRRSLALEIHELAGLDPQKLSRLVDPNPEKD